MTKHAALAPHRALWGANGVRQTLGFQARDANHPSNRAVADEVPTRQSRRSPLAEQLFAKDVQELLNRGYGLEQARWAMPRCDTVEEASEMIDNLKQPRR